MDSKIHAKEIAAKLQKSADATLSALKAAPWGCSARAEILRDNEMVIDMMEAAHFFKAEVLQ